MFVATLPGTTCTFDDASSVSRSFLLRTAVAAVAVQTPLTHDTFFVVPPEIVSAAFAEEAEARNAAAIAKASMLRGTPLTRSDRSMLLLRRRIVYEVREAVVDRRILGPDRGIETCWQAGLELRCRQSGDAGFAFATNTLTLTACLRIPVVIAETTSSLTTNESIHVGAAIA